MNTYGYDNSTEVLSGCLLVLAILVFWAFLMAFPTMWLWNWLMPHIFNLPTLTWTEALGLNLLCGLLFKSTSTTNSKS